MSLSNTTSSLNAGNLDDITSCAKPSNNLVVRIDQDSDDNLQALFDSVLNPGDSKRPLQVPFRMRKLPNSFFNPPSVGARPPSVSHSRANSADSAYDPGSQPNVDQSVIASSTTTHQASPISTSVPQAQTVPTRLPTCHSRAHSSPASLQQTYVVHSGNINCDSTALSRDGIGSTFATNLINFTADINASSTIMHQCVSQGTNGMQTTHMKQRSYDVVSPIQLQNEFGALPPGWEQAKTNDGQIYYLNHTTKTTQWEDPRIQFKKHRTLQRALNNAVNIENTNKESGAINDGLGPLPEGWEQAFTESGDIYFINHINRTTSWNDPRIPDFLQKSLKVQKSEIGWVNVSHLNKDQPIFKQKPDQNALTRHNGTLQMDAFISGDNHARQESSDSGLSLSSNTFPVNTEFISQIDDSMDCINENSTTHPLDSIDCPDNLVSSLQLEDNICNEMFNDVQSMLNSPSNKPDYLEWYKIN